jgi:hypothetical protein
MFPFPFGELARYVDELPTREHFEAMRDACEPFAALADAWSRHPDVRAAATLNEIAIHLRAAVRHFEALANTPPTLRPGQLEEPDAFREGMENVVPPGASNTGGDMVQAAPTRKPYTPPTLRLIGSVRNIDGLKPDG